MGYLVMKDHKRFLAVEEAVLRVAPSRQMRVERTLAKDNLVVVEAVLFGADKDTGEAWEMPWCAVLTFENSKIVTDRTYMDHLKLQTAFPFQRQKVVPRS
ncbi:MAG: nuclear transport factor 2 family protein [Deltaproteobacteria bacterium]|nr:nuclear transport factor 2 family protein [Deltaproteobacteria bacterium]